MAVRLMFISNDDTQNHLFFRLLLLEFETQLNAPTNQKSPKSQRISKHYHKTLGTSAINSPISPPFLM